MSLRCRLPSRELSLLVGGGEVFTALLGAISLISSSVTIPKGLKGARSSATVYQLSVSTLWGRVHLQYVDWWEIGRTGWEQQASVCVPDSGRHSRIAVCFREYAGSWLGD